MNGAIIYKVDFMNWTFINIIKGFVFYTTLCLVAWSIGVVLADLSWEFKCGWLAFVIPFVVVTYFMCKGKSVKEIKEFTGIDAYH